MPPQPISSIKSGPEWNETCHMQVGISCRYREVDHDHSCFSSTHRQFIETSKRNSRELVMCEAATQDARQNVDQLRRPPETSAITITRKPLPGPCEKAACGWLVYACGKHPPCTSCCSTGPCLDWKAFPHISRLQSLTDLCTIQAGICSDADAVHVRERGVVREAVRELARHIPQHSATQRLRAAHVPYMRGRCGEKSNRPGAPLPGVSLFHSPFVHTPCKVCDHNQERLGELLS